MRKLLTAALLGSSLALAGCGDSYDEDESADEYSSDTAAGDAYEEPTPAPTATDTAPAPEPTDGDTPEPEPTEAPQDDY